MRALGSHEMCSLLVVACGVVVFFTLRCGGCWCFLYDQKCVKSKMTGSGLWAAALRMDGEQKKQRVGIPTGNDPADFRCYAPPVKVFAILAASWELQSIP